MFVVDCDTDSGWFLCEGHGMCVPNWLVCNGFPDCYNGADEWNCTGIEIYVTFKCTVIILEAVNVSKLSKTIAKLFYK